MYDPRSACSTETSKELCHELGVEAETWWGRVNGYLCDAYHEGQADARRELARLRADNEALRRGAIRAGAEMAGLRREAVAHLVDDREVA